MFLFSGYNAKRHPINGSWFVQKLCEVFCNNAWEHDIDSMMKMVSCFNFGKINNDCFKIVVYCVSYRLIN